MNISYFYIKDFYHISHIAFIKLLFFPYLTNFLSFYLL